MRAAAPEVGVVVEDSVVGLAMPRPLRSRFADARCANDSTARCDVVAAPADNRR
jgi:hypothetical protein